MDRLSEQGTLVNRKYFWDLYLNLLAGDANNIRRTGMLRYSQSSAEALDADY